MRKRDGVRRLSLTVSFGLWIRRRRFESSTPMPSLVRFLYNEINGAVRSEWVIPEETPFTLLARPLFWSRYGPKETRLSGCGFESRHLHTRGCSSMAEQNK